MAIPAQLAALAGNWAGTNQLWLDPTQPAAESAATATITTAAGGRFLALGYTWSEGGPQEGLLLVGQTGPDGAATASWIDSWHNGDAMMICHGAVQADGRVAVRGSYPAPSGPDWGWRIVVEPDGPDGLRLLMFNIMPDGQEFPAVRADFQRSAPIH